ncbi:MAG: alpha-hydroxy-acid oxidizing protein, partial [Candidatus Methanomethylophilaceae archaeon]|nr:alpha-hydroxy-acid oxidizing protein [Candidatus Methanomethylophilaceae archaeon]
GTSFAAVELHRAMEAGDNVRSNIGDTFLDWGIPAPVSLVEAGCSGLPLIASGGILDGIHVASAIAMGASCAGMANAILREACESADAVKEKLTIIKEELKAAMLLTGSKDIKALSQAKHVVLGESRAWMESI